MLEFRHDKCIFVVDMKSLRESKYFRFFWLALALHILNISIDAPDRYAEDFPEDLTINDIESISELVLEDFLLIDNAIAEHDEQDNADGLSFEISKILLYAHAFPCFKTTEIHYSEESINLPLYKNWMMNQFHPDQVAPPPKV